LPVSVVFHQTVRPAAPAAAVLETVEATVVHQMHREHPTLQVVAEPVATRVMAADLLSTLTVLQVQEAVAVAELQAAQVMRHQAAAA
jgi:hypothetical protein